MRVDEAARAGVERPRRRGEEAPEPVGPGPAHIRGPTRRVRTLLLLNLAAASAYVVWWLTPGHTGTPLLFLLLAAAEAFTLLHLLGFWWAVWGTRFVPPARAVTAFTVDVLIPTRGEPLPVLERTVRAAVAMQGPHRTVVLDDGGRPEVERLARETGADYLRRSHRTGAKAGNLNHALARTRGELVAVFDADHAPRRDFLVRLVGYFEDPGVAFVQTPQYYGNGADNEVARGAYEQQAIFYGPICRGKNGLEAAFCCGTNVLFRRRALEEVGGFDERSVVEDFVTSMRIHRRGWRSVYYPFVLAEGLGPGTIRSYFRQQFRWARGSIGALMSLEPFRRGFAPAQRFQYFLATTFYLIGAVTAIYVLLPILYLLGGWSAFSDRSGTFVFFYLPYLLLALSTVRWSLGDQLRLEHLQYTFGSFPVYAAAAVAALLHLPARFRVTDKAGDERARRPPPVAALPVAAFAATAAALVLGPLLRPLDARTLTNMSWGVVNLILLSGIVGAVVRETLRRRAEAPVLQPVAGGAGAAPAGILADTDRLVLPERALPERRPRSARAPARPPLPLRPARAVAALTAAGLALRLAFINVQSLRLDESLSLAQVQEFSLAGLWRFLLTSNVHVPLYHTMLKGWVTVAGTSEWAIRLPSVLLGTAAVPLLYAVGRRLVGSRGAVFAAAVGAAAPFWVWHADEARMYPLLLVLTLAPLLLLMRAEERGGAGRWLAYGLVTGLSFYSHYFALLMPAVHLLYLVVRRVRRRTLAAWAGATAVAGLAFLPWVLGLYLQRIQEGGIASLTSGVRLPSQDLSVFGILYGLLFFLLVFVIGYWRDIGQGAGVLAITSRVVAGGWPLLVLLGMTSRRVGRWFRSRAAAFLAGWVLLTVGVVFLLNLWKPGLWQQRYLTVASPAILIALGAGVAAAVRRRRAVALTLAFLAFAGLTAYENLSVTNPVREDFRRAAAIVEAGFRPGDAVVVIPKFYTRPFLYYFEGSPVYGLQSGEVPPEVVAGEQIPSIAQGRPGRSLWVILLFQDAFDPNGIVRLTLDARYRRVELHRLGGEMELRRYEVPAAGEPAAAAAA